MSLIPALTLSRLASLALGAALAAQDAPAAPATTLDPAHPATSLTFDAPGDGHLWALGATYKASFGVDGFFYVPFFGSSAPRNHPVQFTLRSVRVGGHAADFRTGAAAIRDGSRVTFDRGPVHEIYDLTPTSVEQTFVVDADRGGDVDVELEIATDLVEDAARAGLQFGNELGHVEYGTAWLVRGATKVEIQAALAGRTLHLHVPASQRDAGPVVIDPIIRTTTLTPTLMASTLPDIAYDATTDRWLATWVHVFSQTDHDVVAELRNGSSDPVAGSFRVIDISGTSFTSPRTANLASADRFLIAMERFDPTDPVRQYTVWGRTMDAPVPFVTGALFEISPNSGLNQGSLDVGGDSGTGTRWTVVWVHGGANIGAADLLGRQVEANGTVVPNTFFVETLPQVCTFPAISLSNGNGLVTSPRWCVAYSVQASATDADVRACMIDLGGNVVVDRAVATAFTNDLFPNVSSPMIGLDGQPRFMISYEQQQSSSEMVVRVVDASVLATFPEVNLTRRYGFSGVFSRVESDGNRFAATCKVGSTLRVGTLAVVDNDIVLHEAMQPLTTGDFPHIASKRSGGGVNTEYGIVFIDTSNPSRTVLSQYQGRSPTGGFARRFTSCGVDIDRSGQPFLGNTVEFSLSRVGNDVPGFVMGLPVPTTTLCGTCGLGVDLAQAQASFGSLLSLRLPRNARLVGLTVAVQGFALGSGPCNPAAARVSDTFDVTIQ